ncbi:MAG: uroporphyrinogen-III synthase [Deltaproteobacteria bacterium]|nr:uroporphyrinogen-III synthase [Deltaproteobacteria bacterium]
MAALIRKQGAEPFVAPSMREVPLAERPAALAFAHALAAGEVDVVVLLTGVGTRALVDAMAPVLPRERAAQLLDRTTLVARGPKPVAALRALGLVPALTVPEPGTWRELLAALDAAGPLAGTRVAVQEYGAANPELLDGLRARGARVTAVPVYRWALPEDLGPLAEAIARLVAGNIEVALFTSATQVVHLLQVADARGVADPLRVAFARVVVGSIGPVCSAALAAAGLAADLEPSRPKMGPLVTETLRAAPGLLAGKRRAEVR